VTVSAAVEALEKGGSPQGRRSTEEAALMNGPFTEVQGAKSPYMIPVGSEIRFYRASN
jgi:hypothetical protein